MDPHLTTICRAMRVISPQSKLVFHPEADLWKVAIVLGDVILVESTGTAESVFADLAERIGVLADRLANTLRQE